MEEHSGVENISSLKQKLQKLKELNLPSGEYMVVSSGSLAIRGIREAKDLDIITTKNLWDELCKKHKVILNESNIETIEIAKDIEILNPSQSCFVTSLEIPIEELLAEADTFEGVRFMNLQHIRTVKLKLGREKDLRDVALIDTYLEKSQV